MVTTQLNYGIPDVDLALNCGGSVNPSCFAGHQLVVLFLPEDAKRQVAELETYEKLADELLGTDAWFLVIADRPPVQDHAKPVAIDPHGEAWRAFKEVADEAELNRSAGAAFLFTRGGAFHRVWAGVGNADAVVQELLSRS